MENTIKINNFKSIFKITKIKVFLISFLFSLFALFNIGSFAFYIILSILNAATFTLLAYLYEKRSDCTSALKFYSIIIFSGISQMMFLFPFANIESNLNRYQVEEVFIIPSINILIWIITIFFSVKSRIKELKIVATVTALILLLSGFYVYSIYNIRSGLSICLGADIGLPPGLDPEAYDIYRKHTESKEFREHYRSIVTGKYRNANYYDCNNPYPKPWHF